MTGRAPIVLEDGPAPAVSPYTNDEQLVAPRKENTIAFWNRCMVRRRFELAYDPTGDFRKGARFGAENICTGSSITSRVYDAWPEGTTFLDRTTKKVYLVKDHYLVRPQ